MQIVVQKTIFFNAKVCSFEKKISIMSSAVCLFFFFLFFFCFFLFFFFVLVFYSGCRALRMFFLLLFADRLHLLFHNFHFNPCMS